MIYEVKKFFGLKKHFHNVEYFETESYRQTFTALKTAVKLGEVIILSGIAASGKTILARSVRKDLRRQGEVLVSVSLSMEKEKLDLDSVIFAMFADLDTEEIYKPIAGKFTKEQLIELIKRKNKPVALFIDDAHDLNREILSDLEKLVEFVQKENAALSVVLIGNFELEKLGGEFKVIRLEGIQGEEANYLRWLLSEYSGEGIKPEDIFTEEAMELISQSFHTPLKINYYAWKVLEEACLIGRKPVEEGTVKEVLMKLAKGWI